MKKLVNLAIAFAVITAASTSMAKIPPGSTTAPPAQNCNKRPPVSMHDKTAFSTDKNGQKKTAEVVRKGTS